MRRKPALASRSESWLNSLTNTEMDDSPGDVQEAGVAALNRREFLKASGAVSLSPLWPRGAFASRAIRRVRPADPSWPSKEAWKHLNEAVGGNLIPVDFPMNACMSSFQSADCKTLFANLKNPYYIGDNPGITQTLGWVDGWATKPSVYAVAARNADDIAAAVNFARDNNLRLVVKGGGHSYQGTSNAPDSLLIWTRHMHDVTIQQDFVPGGCKSTPLLSGPSLSAREQFGCKPTTPSPPRPAPMFKAADALPSASPA